MIWAAHGVVDGADGSLFVHRNLVDRERFAAHLENRGAAYVSLEEAAAGRGDALTLDDATVAAAEAARMAREAGHEVTLFVNPEQVVESMPYHFAALNAVLDRLSGDVVELDGRSFSVATPARRERARKQIKSWVAAPPTAAERLDRVAEVARAAGVDDLSVPAHLRTLHRDELDELAAAGVRLGNHGWGHGNYFALQPAAVLEEVRRGRAWLERELAVSDTVFAVPYGELLPPRDLAGDECSLWLLNCDTFRPGPLRSRVFNRPALQTNSDHGLP